MYNVHMYNGYTFEKNCIHKTYVKIFSNYSISQIQIHTFADNFFLGIATSLHGGLHLIFFVQTT